MMTIKIITNQPDGYYGTHLFTAERVIHYERILNDGQHPDETFDTLCQRLSPKYVVTGLGNPNTSQNMHYSSISLYAEDDDVSPLLVSAPAHVYVMLEGKTIDHYHINLLD